MLHLTFDILLSMPPANSADIAIARTPILTVKKRSKTPTCPPPFFNMAYVNNCGGMCNKYLSKIL